jgi:hypothetical protein
MLRKRDILSRHLGEGCNTTDRNAISPHTRGFDAVNLETNRRRCIRRSITTTLLVPPHILKGLLCSSSIDVHRCHNLGTASTD